MTDLWFRNADRAMAVCAQEGVSRLTWTRQHLGRLKMDGITYVRQFYMHTAVRPKIMLIGIQGTSEYDIFSKLTEPKAVYPTWSGKNDSWDDLQRLIDNPWGEDKSKCEDLSITSALRPVYGQKHRIIIHNNPSVVSGIGKRYWLNVSRVQEDNPGVELFVNGPLSFATLFGLKFVACDFGLSDLGDRNNYAQLPNGLKLEFDKTDHPRGTLYDLSTHSDWITLVGLTPKDVLQDQNKRFALRIRSAKWAAKHWERNLRFFRSSSNLAPDQIDASEDEFAPNETNRIILRHKQFSLKEADKILCNRCRIQVGCKFYRTDSICGVIGSEMNELEKYFQSRNAGSIIDGLAKLTQLQARRLEATMESESQGTEVNPEVDKQVKTLFDMGVKLAKLVDPNLAGPGTKIQINNGVQGAAQVVANSNPKQMMASIVEALELQGIPRDKITPDMVSGILKSMNTNSDVNAIEAAAVKFSDLMGGSQSPPVAHPIIIDKQDYDKQVLSGELVPVKKTGRD